MRKSDAYKKYSTFKWGGSMATNELDIQFILSSIRKANAAVSALLNRQQQILWKYQSSNLIFPDTKANSNYVVFKTSDYKTKYDRLESDINIEVINLIYSNIQFINELIVSFKQSSLTDEVSLNLARGNLSSLYISQISTPNIEY